MTVFAELCSSRIHSLGEAAEIAKSRRRWREQEMNMLLQYCQSWEIDVVSEVFYSDELEIVFSIWELTGQRFFVVQIQAQFSC